MTLPINQIATFGDARRMILDTIMELRSGSMDIGRGMAIAANMKVLNDSVQVEINAAKMTIQAQQAGQQQLAFGTGLFNQGAGMLGQYQAGQIGALSPFTTYLGGAGTIESMGQSPLDIGAQLGGRSATAGANAGQALLTGGMNAARTMQVANAYDPWATALQGAANNPNLQRIFNSGGGQPAPIEDRSGGGGTWGGGGGYGSVYY